MSTLVNEVGATDAGFDTKRLRQILLTAHPESKPAEIEKRIRTLLSEREFRQTMQLIQSVGAEVAYHALDVQDSVAFGELIQQIYQKPIALKVRTTLFIN